MERTFHLAKLVEHMAWADERVLQSLRNTRAPLDAAIALYAHVIGAEHVWLRRITGEPAELSVWPEVSLEECERISRVNVTGFRELARSTSGEDLDRPITYCNTAGLEFTTRLEDILLHVALHGSYHRGQVAAMLRSAGDEPNPTDYIQWVRGTPAAISGPR